ncbi:ACBP-domain-containing protein [Meredithblackwellia eburnea MCA 4105]
MTSTASFTTTSRLESTTVTSPFGSDPAWIDARFERAVDIVQSLPRNGPIQTNYDDKLLLYSVYKQASEGDIKTNRPGMLDILGRAKWDAWNKRKGVSEDDAKRLYVEGLIKILKGFSDRQQAVDLIRELETFSLEPSRGQSGSAAESGSISGETASSTTPPPPQATASQSRSSLPLSSSQHEHQHSSARRPPIPAAPSLPGYGPPRTVTDSLRAPPSGTGSRRQQHQPERYSSDEDDTGSGSGSETDNNNNIPPRRFGTPASQIQAQQYLPQHQHYSSSQQGQGQLRPMVVASGGPNRILSPPIPGQPYPAFSPQQPMGVNMYPHPHPSRALSPSPNIHTQGPLPGGMTAVAYPAGFRPLSAQQVASSYQTSLQQQPQQQQQMYASLPNLPSAQQQSQLSAAVPTPATTTTTTNPVALDAALDRLQTSLTALHERLRSLEQLNLAPNSVSNPSLSALLWSILSKVLQFLHLRQRTTGSGSGSSLSLRTELGRLVRMASSWGRRLLGDLGVAVLLVVLVGRVTGRGEEVVRILGRAVGVGEGRAGRRLE